MPSDDYGDRCAMLEEILCDEAARLEQLHMATETVHDLIFLGHLLGYAAPKVYSLSLGTCTASDMRRLTYANTLFDGQCRSIRKLTVVDFPIWELNIFSNLSHLAVYSTRNESGKLQDILERSPNLEELIITDVDMSDDRRSMISISLPRLQNLQLNMQVLADNDISSFVSRMDIPSSCRYQVAHARLQDVMSVASAPLFRPIQDNIHTAQLLVRCGPVRMAIFHGVLSVECSWRDVAGLSGKLDPSFELVVIFSDGAVIKRNWMDLFSPMLHVRSLVITDHHEGRCCANTSRVAPLFDVLSSPFSHTVGPARHNTPVLPALESVRIYGASVDVWLPLWSAVSQRARAGAPLQELSIYEEPVDYRTSGTVRRISLDTAGLASRVATEESIVGAADIMAKIEYELKPKRPVDGLAWARRGRQ
ncbi:hypothetical protein GGG16DRAFT_119105 [Schizophyllum commune]